MDRIEKVLIFSMAVCASMMLLNFVYEGAKLFL
jgi:cell division protein FtsL